MNQTIKKTFIFGLALFLVVGAGVLVFTNKTNAEDALPPQIISIYYYVRYNTISIDWTTDEYTKGKVEYGKNSGNYTNSVEDTTWIDQQQHNVHVADLEYSTTYYFRIVATDLAGNVTNSDEQSFITESNDLVFTINEFLDVSDKYAIIYVETNKNSFVGVKYGTSSNNYVSETGSLGGVCAIAPCHKEHLIIIKKLRPQTTYYYKINAVHFPGMSEPPYYEINSQESSFTTTATPVINSIDPDHGPSGTEITITGQNFGKAPLYNEPSGPKGGRVSASVGCDFDSTPPCWADVISWSNTQIVIKTNDSSKTGPVFVSKQYGQFFFGVDDRIVKVQGPTFKVVGGGQPPKNENVNTAPPATNYVTNAYGCDFSTSKSDANIIKVSTLFTKGSDTDNYLSQVYNAYKDNWNRYPYCNEMQFHLDHSTPIDRLTSWLKNEKITEKYGCKISTTAASDDTLRLKTPLTLNNDTDKYLNQVYNAYYENWGRYPYCTEMQFHLDHSTPIDRLTSWLKENKPKVANVNAAPTEVVTKKVEFKDTGTKVELKDKTQTLKFNKDDQITFTGQTIPNAFIVLTINSEEPTIGTTVSDSKGKWVYTLPGPLEVGDHTVKVAVSNKDGKKVSESDPVSFSIIATAKAAEAATPTEINEEDNTFIYMIVAVAAAFVIILVIYLVTRKKPNTLEKK